MKVVCNKDDWTYITLCEGVFKSNPGCYEPLIINGDDIHVYKDIDGLTGELIQERYSFTCPMCGKETIVPDEIIPDYVKEKANTKKLKLVYYDKCM